MVRNMKVLVWKEDDSVIAKDEETHVASQGTTVFEALMNLREALELYYEDVPIQKEIALQFDLIIYEKPKLVTTCEPNTTPTLVETHTEGVE